MHEKKKKGKKGILKQNLKLVKHREYIVTNNGEIQKCQHIYTIKRLYHYKKNPNNKNVQCHVNYLYHIISYHIHPYK